MVGISVSWIIFLIYVLRIGPFFTFRILFPPQNPPLPSSPTPSFAPRLPSPPLLDSGSGGVLVPRFLSSGAVGIKSDLLP